MIKVLTGLILSFFCFAAMAQEKIKTDTVPVHGEKKDQQKVITVRIKGDKATQEKYTIEIDGSKIKVNGKDVADLKDIDVSVGEHKIILNGKDFQVNGFSKEKMEEMKKRMRDLQDQRMDFQRNQLQFKGKLADFQNRALLGIGMEKVKEGVKITSVTKESGADKAGLKEGDIITKIDEKDILAEMDITKIVSENKPGKEIAVTYLREGKKNTTRAVLGKREDDFGYGDAMEKFKMDSFKFDMPAFKFDMPPMQHFDFKFDGNAPDLKIYKDFAPFQGMHPFGEMGGPKLGVTLKETESGNGLEISSVAENSVAEKAGLQKGDIVTKAAGKDVNNIGEMVEIIAANRENSFDINYLRNGKPGKAAIKFDKKTKEISL